MKLFYLALSLIFFFIPFSILGETMRDLIWNNGLYYKKGSKNPFDGIVTGEINGSFKNGKRHGKWTRYYNCLLYTSPSPRDKTVSRMPSSA